MPEPLKQLTPEEVKQSIESGVQKWLDKRYAELGKWALRGILVAVVGGLAKLLIGAGLLQFK